MIRLFPPDQRQRVLNRVTAAITSPKHLNKRRERSYPRVVKRARHNSYRVKKPGQHGTRHNAPATIKLINPVPTRGKTDIAALPKNKLSGIEGMPHDIGPGQSRQVGAGVFIAEYPPVIPELLELPEVPADDPAFRLTRVAPARPLIGELPQVVVQGTEHPGRHHRPVVGDPAPCDRDDFRQYRCDVGPAECAELLRKPVPEPLDGRGARLDEQLAVGVAAEVKSEEIEPLGLTFRASGCGYLVD